MTSPQTVTQKLDACIHCGLCLPACPTYLVTGSEAESPRGRLYLMRKMIEGELDSPEQLTRHLDQCLACHGCETACPSGVQYGSLLLSAREHLADRPTTKLRQWQRKFKRWMLRNILPQPVVLTTMALLLKVYQKSSLQWLVRQSGLLTLLPLSLKNMDSLLPSASVVRKPLVAGMRFGPPEAQKQGQSVALMTGCVMDVFFNPVHWATIQVLTTNGFQVHIPEQTCCGALAHHAGEVDITRALARQNIDTILNGDHGYDYIVLNSAGCGSTMQAYDELLADDPAYAEKAKVFASKVIDVMALLGKKKAESGLLAPITPVNQRVSYHPACHLYHVQKVRSTPEELLRMIPGLTLIPLPDAELCCGSAGVYNIEQPELANEILAQKMQSIRQVFQAHHIQTIATGNPGCLMQLQKGLYEQGMSIQVCHPIELLANAYTGQGVS